VFSVGEKSGKTNRNRVNTWLQHYEWGGRTKTRKKENSKYGGAGVDKVTGGGLKKRRRRPGNRLIAGSQMGQRRISTAHGWERRPPGWLFQGQWEQLGENAYSDAGLDKLSSRKTGGSYHQLRLRIKKNCLQGKKGKNDRKSCAKKKKGGEPLFGGVGRGKEGDHTNTP